MEHLTLTATKRERGTKGKLSAMRREGRIPCVVYGPKSEPKMAEVKATDMRLILPKRNHVIEMNLDGEVQAVMVKQVERDPVRQDVLHVDFLRVDEIHAVTVSVPVIPQGVPIGVKLQGGVFKVAKKNVKLKAKVQDIPENFMVDVSGFESGKTFYVKDLQFEKGVFVTPPRTALFGVGIARKEEEIAPAAEKAAAAPAATPEAAGDGKEKAAPAAGGKGGAKPSK